MFRKPVIILLTVLLLPTLAGCRYDGSFMQMDSNSAFPFFGLTLAVDSGSRPPDPKGALPQHKPSPFDLNLPDSDISPFGSHSGHAAKPGEIGLVRVRN
jgi:hypothetical protein